MTEEQAEYKTGAAGLFASAARIAHQDIEDLLDELHQANIDIAYLNAEMAGKMHDAIPVEVQDAIAEIETDYIRQIENIKQVAKVVTADIEAFILERQASAQCRIATEAGKRLTAIYNKGREGGWDNDKLKGYAMAHPEIMGAKKPDGKPYVTFREC